MKSLIPIEGLESCIYFIRGHRVMIDQDLAKIYRVQTKVLNQAVHRNPRRFPPDFMFQLTAGEYASLRSQIVTSKEERGGRRYLPFAFTENGAVMLSAVLKTLTAIDASVQITRAFNKMRELLSTHKDLTRKLEALEKKYDARFKAVFEAIRQLLEKPSRHAPIRVKGFTKE